MDKGINSMPKASDLDGPLNELNEFDIDGSSSLSEIEEKGPRELIEEYEEDEDDEEDEEEEDEEGNKEYAVVYENLGNMSEAENDSEAETECLERPKNLLPRRNLILSQPLGYDNCLNKLQINFNSTDRREDKEDPTKSAELLVDVSPDLTKNSFQNDAEEEIPAAPISLNHRNVTCHENISDTESHNRKRKRSIMGVTGLNDLSEPLCKRTGSILINCGEYSIEDEATEDISNPTTENLSADEGEALQDDSAEDTEELNEVSRVISELPDVTASLKRRGCKKRPDEHEIIKNEDDPEDSANINTKSHDLDENIVSTCLPIEEEEENEAALRNEEATERKRIAFDRLGHIERQFSTFRDRLYEERLKRLDDEDAMLRQVQPTHPEFLAMLQCIDARRDEKIHRADKLRQYEFQSLKKVAVAQRSQILVQYQQEIRELRERKLEQLGEQWYKIQHDRRSYAGICPEFSIKFPPKKSQQIANQIAYCNEVSLLSGVAKYVGFPAAPIMAPASSAELEEDLEKMGRSKQLSHVAAILPLQELVTLRSASSNPKSRPAEEQFIEQTPWANPHHPLHAHVLQKQPSSSQIPRTISLLAKDQIPSRRIYQTHDVVPNSGMHSTPPAMQHIFAAKAPASSQNKLQNSSNNNETPTASSRSRQKSLSPGFDRGSVNAQDQAHELSNVQVRNKIKGARLSSAVGVSMDCLRESRLSI